MRTSTIATIFTILALPAPAQSIGDAAAGEALFKKCSACHQIGEGAENKIGPVLTGVINRSAGSYEGYRYGRSMTAAGEAGLVWTTDNIFAYLEGPKPFLREFLDDRKAKAKMAFRLNDPQDRLDIIAYLATFEMASLSPANGFCVENASEGTHFFTVDAGRDTRIGGELAAGETLCTASFDTPKNGVVSVFETADALEGCSRLVTAGSTETLMIYADFDRCKWSSHNG